MLTFGQLLGSIIEGRKINKKELCEKLCINRSLLYRYLSGKAIPSKEILNKLITELMLTPAEMNMLEKAYEVSCIGKEKYRCRKLIKEVLEKHTVIKRSEINIDQKAQEELISLLHHRGTYAITGFSNVVAAVRNIFEESIHKGVDEVLLSVQPDNEAIMGELFWFLNHSQARIKHIYRLCMGKTYELNSPLALNLEQQKNVIHACFPFESQTKKYMPGYYYDYSLTQTKNLLLQPVRLVTQNHLMILSDDNEKGIIVTDKDIVSVYYREMEALFKKTIPLIRSDNYIDKLTQLDIIKMFCSPEITIAPEPSPLFARAEIYKRNRKNKSNGDFDQAYGMLLRKYMQALSSGIPVIILFTVDGLEQMIQTGDISLLGKEIETMNRLQIKDYLTLILEYAVRYENVYPHIIVNDFIQCCKNYNWIIYKDIEMQLMPKNKPGKLIYNISEHSFVKAISDYFFNVVPTLDVVTTKQETMEVLRRRIDTL